MKTQNCLKFFMIQKCLKIFQKESKENTEGKKLDALNVNLSALSSESIKILKSISHQEAELYFANGEPVLAACSELAMGSSESAVIKLIRANELFLAFFVAKILKLPCLDEIQQLLALRMMKFGQIEHALKFYKNCRDNRLYYLQIAKNKMDYQKNALQSQKEYEKMAKDSKNSDAVYYYLMAQNNDEAARVAIESTKSKGFLFKILEILAEKRFEQFGELLEIHSLIQTFSAINLSTE